MSFLEMGSGDVEPPERSAIDQPGKAFPRPVGEELTAPGAVGRDGPGVEAILVDLAYSEGTVNEKKQLRLSGNAHAEWQVELHDAGKRGYQITTTWEKSDGFNIKVGPSTTSATYVPIPGNPPEPR